VAAALVESLAPGSGLGLAVHDADLCMLLISPSLAELSGASAEAQLGRRLTEALPGEIGEVAEASLRRVAATREPLLHLEPAVEAGRERGWLISVYPLVHDSRELIAVIALDVTESRRAQERLQHSRERLAEAQRMASVGSWSWDVQEDSWTWSEMPESSRETVRRATAAALDDGQPFELSLPLLLPGGERRVLHGRGVPVRDDAGTVVRVDGFAQDVTERLRAEAQQRTAAALGRLALSGMPLDALQGQAAEAVADELERPGDEDAAFLETVSTILASAAERLRREEALAEYSVARGRLVAQALDAEDRARRSVSEALHDGPLQDLLALGHEISRLQPAAEGDAYHLGRVRDGIARAVQQIRDVMLDLHPVMLQVGGLDSALRAICTRHARADGYRCEVEIDPRAAGGRDELVLSLARELLRNVGKHARAGRVDVRVSRTEEGIALEVSDDGAGFEHGRLREALGQGHIGVASSRERAEAIGGRMSVGPRADGASGTQAVAVLPLA